MPHVSWSQAAREGRWSGYNSLGERRDAEWEKGGWRGQQRREVQISHHLSCGLGALFVLRCFLGTFGKQGIEYKICFLPEDLTLV